MSIKLGSVVIDHIVYDGHADVLYLSAGPPREVARLEATRQGHHVRYDEGDEVIGVTIVNAKWLLDRGDPIEIPLRVDSDEHAAALD